MMKSAVLVVLALSVYLVAGQSVLEDIPQQRAPIGVAGNGTIWYQSTNSPAYPYFSFGNVQNPIAISIIYDIGAVNYDASICLNYQELNYPIEGVNLFASCPAGAYGTASNTSTEELPAYKTSGSYVSSKSKFISSRLAMATPADTTTGTYSTVTTTAQLYVKPSTASGAFIVTIPDAVDLQNFNVFFSGQQCNDTNYYPVGTNGACVQIATAEDEITLTLQSETWQYYQVTSAVASSALVVYVNGTNDGIELYVQRDYYPTRDWYLNTQNVVDDDDGDITATVLGPQPNEVYFIGIYNSDSDAQTFYFNQSFSDPCQAGSFGLNCKHQSSDITSPLTGAVPISANLTQGVGVPNNGSAWSFAYDDDDTDYEGDYAYFYLTSYPNYTTPYYIRVSVGNNDPNDENGAPPLFGAKGYYPSAQSNAYNMSTLGDVAHQIVVQIDDNDLQSSNDNGGNLPTDQTWYFAVQLPVDFSIWVGANCAANCSNGKHGDCYCGNVTCASITNNGKNPQLLYVRTNSLEDSAGACTCSDDDYDKSFDCTQRANGNSVLYIVLIAVGGFIVLAVAVGVPLYCFIANRKENDYDRVV